MEKLLPMADASIATPVLLMLVATKSGLMFKKSTLRPNLRPKGLIGIQRSEG